MDLYPQGWDFRPNALIFERCTMHVMKSHNTPVTPGSLAAQERLDEIAGLLAAGILRLNISQAQDAMAQAKKNSPNKREKQLDASARKSVHASRTRV